MTCLKVAKCGRIPAYAGIVALSFVLTVWVMPVGAITGGEEDGDGHPNVGAVIVKSDRSPPFVFCSGTLIGERVFLTSGRCTHFLRSLLEEEPPRERGIKVFVSFNPDNALDEGAWLLVKKENIITHRRFNRGPASNPRDVGVLILEGPGPDITPAVLPKEGLLDALRAEGKLLHGHEGAEFTVVGYGATLEWPPPEIYAPDGKRYVAESEYLNLRKVWLHMSQNRAPPGREDEDNTGGTSYGDFGGPVFWVEEGDDGTEIKTLVAITFWGDAQRVATGTSYRVDISDTLEFIYEHVPRPPEPDLAPRRTANRLAATWWGRVRSD